MPIVESLMSSLKKRYGDDEGERVYYAMEAEGSGPFGPRGKHHQLHKDWAKRNGVKPLSSTKKKARPRKKAGPKRRR